MKKELFVLCVATILFSSLGLSQTWEEYFKLSDKYINGIDVNKNLDSAIFFGDKALENVLLELGEMDTNTAFIEYLLGAFYYQKQDFTKAESLWTSSVKIWEKTVNYKHPTALETFSSLVNLIDDLGRHEEALELSHQLLQLRIKLFGENHFSVGRNYSTLAVINFELGRYSDVEPLLLKALSIYDKCNPIPYHYKGLIYNTYGVMKQHQKKYVEAETLFQKGITMFQLYHGPQSLEEGMCLSNIGDSYLALSRYVEAESCYVQSLRMWQKKDSTHFWIPVGMRNLAEVYQKQKKYAEAKSLYDKLIRIHSNQFQGDHPWIAEDVLSLANFYRERQQFDTAIVYYQRALNIFSKTLLSSHEKTAGCLFEMSRLYRMMGDLLTSFLLADSSFKIRYSNLQMISAGVTENDAIQYSQSITSAAYRVISSFNDIQRPSISQVYEIASVVLKTKGQITDEMLCRNDYYSIKADNETKNKLRKHRQIREIISKSFLSIPNEVATERAQQELDSLTKIARLLELDIAYSSKIVRQTKLLSNLSVDKLCSSLPATSQLVEYMKYDYSEKTNDTLTSMYIAVVYNQNEKLSILNLGKSEIIDSLIHEYRRHTFNITNGTNSISASRENDYREITQKIYNLIWNPIASHIKQSTTLFIAPDGALNLVSFAGLMDENGKYLIEKHPLHYLSAGRDLLRLNKKEKSNTGLLAFGDPDYDAPAIARLSHEEQELVPAHVPFDPYSYRNVRSECDILRNLDAAPLPATRREVNAVKEHWGKKYQREIPAVYFGADASEEQFKQQAAGNRVIHLATHGYFLDPSCNTNSQLPTHNSQVLRENPLLQSGLLLAGANLKGADADSLGAEDGILTALEVSAMDLRGTDLVVLSACETGLGEIKAGEGVYGLRRAFQLAGAKTVVSSLWQIPDRETMKFMKELYAQEAQTYPELMQKVMLQRLKELRAQKRSTHPYSWAGFVATGEWSMTR